MVSCMPFSSRPIKYVMYDPVSEQTLVHFVTVHVLSFPYLLLIILC